MASSSEKRLSELNVGDELAYAVKEKKDSGFVKATVEEVGVHIPGYVTPLGVAITYETRRRNGYEPEPTGTVQVTDNKDDTYTAKVRRDVHVKWLARDWSDYVVELKKQKLTKAQSMANKRAEEELREAVVNSIRDIVTDWKRTYRQESWGKRYTTELGTSDMPSAGSRCRIVGGENDGTEYDVLGHAKERCGRNTTAVRVGIIHGFTKTGNPQVHWVLQGEEVHTVDRQPSEKLVAKHVQAITEEVEKALA